MGFLALLFEIVRETGGGARQQYQSEQTSDICRIWRECAAEVGIYGLGCRGGLERNRTDDAERRESDGSPSKSRSSTQVKLQSPVTQLDPDNSLATCSGRHPGAACYSCTT